jgi:DNA-binding response OmpR family regulator
MAGFEQEVAAPMLLAHDESSISSCIAGSPGAATGLTAAELPKATLLICITESIQIAKREVVPVLKGAGYDVDLIEAGTRRPLPLSGKPYRLLLFDIGSKSDNQYRICAQTRLASKLPIMLMLRGAARNDAVRGFQAGADAYVLVPFDPRELLVRLDALLRRSPTQSANLAAYHDPSYSKPDRADRGNRGPKPLS